MAQPPALRRFDILVLLPQANGSLEPAQAIAVTFHRQGATVRGNAHVGSSETTLPVYHPGAIRPTNKLWVDGDSTKILTVASVTSDFAGSSLRVTSNVEMDLAEPVRLIVGDPPTQLYASPDWSTTIGNPLTDGYGRLVGYVREYRFDYIVWTGTRRVFIDAEGSYVMRA